MDPKTLVDNLLHANSSIRFAVISDMNGNIVASDNRSGVTNILSEDETEKSLKRAVNSWKSRNETVDKTGEGKYVLAVYENLKRVTMPIGKDHLVYLTFDADGNNRDVIQSVLNLKPGASSQGFT